MMLPRKRHTSRHGPGVWPAGPGGDHLRREDTRKKARVVVVVVAAAAAGETVAGRDSRWERKTGRECGEERRGRHEEELRRTQAADGEHSKGEAAAATDTLALLACITD